MWNSIRYWKHRLLGPDYWLPGTWRRVNDKFAGCVVMISDTETMEARILICPASMKKYGWLEGDLKWKAITLNGKNQYYLEDLHKKYDKEKQMVTAIGYGPSVLRFISENTIIVGTGDNAQQWRRVSRHHRKNREQVGCIGHP